MLQASLSYELPAFPGTSNNHEWNGCLHTCASLLPVKSGRAACSQWQRGDNQLFLVITSLTQLHGGPRQDQATLSCGVMWKGKLGMTCQGDIQHPDQHQCEASPSLLTEENAPCRC